MWAAAALALMLLASACGASSTTTTTASPPAPTAPATTTTTTTTAPAPPPATSRPPVTTTTAPPPEGTVVVGPGEPIQLRVLQTLSGGAEEFGTVQVQAVELAVADFGPVHGHPVDIGEPLDERCNPDGGRAAGEAVAAQPDVVAVIGTTCSGAAVRATELLAEAGIPMISGSTTSPELTSDTRGVAGRAWQLGFFRTAPNDALQGVAAARFAAGELDATRAVVLHRGDPYTLTLADAFAGTFRDLGGTTALVHCKPCVDTDVDAGLASAAAEGPDMLFLPLFHPEAAAVLSNYREVPGLEEVAIIGGEGLSDIEILSAADSAGIYVVVADRRFATGPEHAQYLARFEQRFGGPPPMPFGFRGDAAAYDATWLLLSAVADVADVDGEALLIDRAALRVRLHATTGLPGVTGRLTCDRFGDCAGHGFVVLQHVDPADPEATRANVVFDAPQPTEPVCHPTITDPDTVVGVDAQAATVDDIEGWALFFPREFSLGRGDPVRLPSGRELKVVFRVTGRGEVLLDAIGPGGQVVAPTDGPRQHVASNWERPGDEFGTGWVLPEPGCWTIRIRRDGRVASLVVEAYGP